MRFLRILILCLAGTAAIFAPTLLPQPLKLTYPLPHTFKGHTTWVLSVAFSPDGKTLASAIGDETITLRDVRTGKQIATLQAHEDHGFYSVAFSPDSKLLVSGSIDNAMVLWDVKASKKR
jgi:WD40 repeat protein